MIMQAESSFDSGEEVDHLAADCSPLGLGNRALGDGEDVKMML